jgi:iron-sulfur cluster repair protein YtfE (RIC family)
MRITDALRGEHGVFYSLFEHLELITSAATSLEAVQSSAALVGAALIAHSKIEDQLLFPALERVIGPHGPLEVMRREHHDIEKGLELIASAADLAAAKSGVFELMEEVHEHFAKEEVVLFGMAEDRIHPEELQRLCRVWSDLRRVSLE